MLFGKFQIDWQYNETLPWAINPFDRIKLKQTQKAWERYSRCKSLKPNR